MMRLIERLVLLTVALFCLAAASCYASGEYTVGYGYTHGYYDDVFYTAPIDRYGGFYGHP
jgi:hypothetical protein